MKLSDKILMLRKQSGISQEELADKLNVSRQAISRWEMGSAQPDANNILQISKLFSVTTDYLLNDDYESDNDLPKVKKVREDNSKQILIYLVTLEVMREENRKMQAEREYLQLAAGNMSGRLKLMEVVSAQNSRAAHALHRRLCAILLKIH